MNAAGNKLEKRTVEVAPMNKSTVTTYIGGAVYENDLMQFMGHEEGRVRVVRGSGSPVYVYDYFVKDHLGNTRMVLTDEQKTDAYPVASLEAGTIATEKLYYNIPDGATVNKNTVAGYPSDTYTNPNDYIQKLNGNGTKVGTSITLKVMSGDSYNLRANSWYRNNGASPASPVSPISSILSALAGGISAASGGKATAATLLSNNTLDPAVGNFLSNQTPISTRPKAFLNWILFDEQFKYVSGGFDQVGNDQEFKTHTQTALPITRNGYLYVYVSNETPNIDVFFDNVQITHIRGPLTEETHYYPFGGTLSAISSKAAGNLSNKYQYNGGNELQNKEFSDGSGLELYDAVHRLYDPQLGRFFQIDKLAELGIDFTPYGFARNNPIRMNDPLGLKEDTLNGTSPEVIVHTSKKKVASKQLNQMDYGQIAAWIDMRTKRGDGAETIGNWALNNPYLTPNTLDKILDANSSAARVIREAQDEAWKAEGELYKFFLTSILLTAGGELLMLAEFGEGATIAGEVTNGIVESANNSKVVGNLLKGFTRHGINQSITRGFKAADILKIIREGKVVQAMGRYGSQLRYSLGGNTVVINAQGKVVSVFSEAVKNGGKFIPF